MIIIISMYVNSIFGWATQFFVTLCKIGSLSNIESRAAERWS